MQVVLPYGRRTLALAVPDSATLVEPADAPALADERAAFVRAVREPIGSAALREIVAATDRVVIVTSDITRATPNDRLVPWLLDELAHVPAEQISVIIGTGSHRATTPAEMATMFGAPTLQRVRVVDHDAHDPARSAYVGTTADGVRAALNTEYLAADVRIVVGFIEPHIYAGFSGGAKGVMPGVADIATVTAFHNARRVGDPRSTWLQRDGNPTAAMSLEIAAMAPPNFLVNVTLDSARNVTGFFCGDYLAAHERGMDFARKYGARAVPHRYDVVVTSNGGYPLDQSLYQCGKGLTAAARIVKPGGTIVLCAELADGIPDHGNFKEMLRSAATPAALLATIEAPGFARYDQWAAQSQAFVQRDARVVVHSGMSDEAIRAAMLEPTSDPERTIRDALAAAGDGATCAVLITGPYVVPFVSETAASELRR
ncbi:MAG: nickel-dependent lactate racemase [Vulcanimicrobiaceae bacterium]